jgi:hypothetical protein
MSEICCHQAGHAVLFPGWLRHHVIPHDPHRPRRHPPTPRSCHAHDPQRGGRNEENCPVHSQDAAPTGGADHVAGPDAEGSAKEALTDDGAETGAVGDAAQQPAARAMLAGRLSVARAEILLKVFPAGSPELEERWARVAVSFNAHVVRDIGAGTSWRSTTLFPEKKLRIPRAHATLP